MNLPEAQERLNEIVEGIRDLSEMSQTEWNHKYPELSYIGTRKPLSTSITDRPVTRFAENLQVELQLRTAEFLCVVHQI